MKRGKSIEALITKSRKSFEALKADYQGTWGGDMGGHGDAHEIMRFIFC